MTTPRATVAVRGTGGGAGTRPLERILRPGTSTNRLLRFGLATITGLVVAIAVRNLFLGYPWVVDAVIPLHAADRWLAGGQPYLAESFTKGPGYELPFLYPPFVLPFVGVLASLPRVPVVILWMLVTAIGGVFALRRLALPTWWIPLFLLWPPFTEAILGGNIQLVLFAAFCALFFAHSARRDAHPVERDPAGPEGGVRDGVLAAAVGALKVSQLQAWGRLLIRAPKRAIAGAAVVGVLVLATLPLTGIDLWRSWLEQLSRANDPAWPLYGASFMRPLPQIVATAIVGLTILGAGFVPKRNAAAWVGILAVIGSPSLRIFGLLFLMPALLTIRRELMLVAMLLIATYTFEGWWLAVILITATLALSHRWPALREPKLEAPPDAAPTTDPALSQA